MTAYYNENDPETVAWLRELISSVLQTKVFGRVSYPIKELMACRA